MTAQLTQIGDLPAQMLTEWGALDDSLRTHLHKVLAAGDLPKVVLQPNDEAQLSAALTLAQAQDWSVLLCGRGSKLSWGNPVTAPVLVVSMAHMNRVIHHAAADLTVTCEAGLTLGELQAQLAQHNQFLPVEPAYPAQATLGGIIATADTGSLRHRYGGLRDMLLGIQFVRADGQVAKAGGRVVKNVAGYDLMKLFTGAYGTLGAISQVTLKTYPIPADFRTVVLTGSLEQLAQAAAVIAPSTLSPVAFDWFSTALTQALDLGKMPAIALRFGNVAASTSEQAHEVELLGQQLGLNVQILDNHPSNQPDNQPEQTGVEQMLWRDLPLQLDQCDLRCKLGILPSGLAALMAQIEAMSPTALVRLHQGSGLGQLCDRSGPWSQASLTQLRQHCDENAGFFTLLEASDNLKQGFDVWGYSGNALGGMSRLREQFDPARTLNPGRFLV